MKVWVASLEDRAIRERLRRRADLVKLRTSARNRIFGLPTQFGPRISFTRLGRSDALELLERRGVKAVWRDSIAEHLDEIAALDRRIDASKMPLTDRLTGRSMSLLSSRLRPMSSVWVTSHPRRRLLCMPGSHGLRGVTRRKSTT